MSLTAPSGIPASGPVRRVLDEEQLPRSLSGSVQSTFFLRPAVQKRLSPQEARPLLLTVRARIGLYSDPMNGVFARSRLESQVIRFGRKARCHTMNLIGA